MSASANAIGPVPVPYRRLVRAYPAGRRREELLDTMIMEAADEARTRPTGREVADVLRNAPRAWLGRPGSRGVVIAAAVFALLTALLTAFLAAQAAATATYDRLPTAAELTELGTVIAPGVPLSITERNDRPPAVLSEQPGYGFARLSGETGDVAQNLRSYTEGVVARLREAGWQTRWIGDAASPDTDTFQVVASRDGLELDFSTYGRDVSSVDPEDRSAASESVGEEFDEYRSLDVAVHRAVSGWVLVAAVLSAVLGLALGWLLAGWASRRTESHLWASSALAVLTAIAGLTVAPLAWYTLLEYVHALSGDNGYDLLSGWLFNNQPLNLTAPAGIAMIGAAVVAVLTRPERGRRWAVPAAPSRRSTKITTAVLLTAAVVTLAGAYLTNYGLAMLGHASVVTAAGVAAVVLLRAATHFRRTTTTASPLSGERPSACPRS